MAYELTYTMSFRDKHHLTPADWRVDILADVDMPPASVITLIPAKNPLRLEYTNSDENKTSWILGRKATITYVVTGAPGEPGVDVFFDTDERFHRVEIYCNNELDGVYYVKPDAGQHPYSHTPYTIAITAVDGIAFAKTIPFAILKNNVLDYRKMSFVQTLISRSLYQMADVGSYLYMVNAVRSADITSLHPLGGLNIHTDIFYSVVDGPVSVFDVFEYFCKTYYARMFPAKGRYWFVRTPDVYPDTVTIHGYRDDVNAVRIDEDINIRVSADTTPAVDNTPTIRMVPAVKTAKFTIDYESINQLVNFDWSDYDGSPGGDGFADWGTLFSAPQPVQHGDGSADNPYSVFLPYQDALYNGSSLGFITQITSNTGQRYYTAGDIVQVAFKYFFTNVTKFYFAVEATGDSGHAYHLNADGTWTETIGTIRDYEWSVTRSGRKRDGNLELQSQPLPSALGKDIYLTVTLFYPNEKSYHTPAEDGDIIDVPVPPGVEGVDVYAIKMGVVGISAKGRNVTGINQSLYSREQEQQDLKFLDTGQPGLSNTIFAGNTPATAVPVIAGWTTPANTTPIPLEHIAAKSNVDGYAKSLRSFEGTLYSNTIQFFNTFTVDTLAGRKFITLSDKYDVETCKHDVLLEEVLPENAATVRVIETDKYE